MNNYTINNMSQTMGYITASLIATALLFNVQAPPVDKEVFQNIKNSTYFSSAVSSTIGQYSNIYSGEFMTNLDPFVVAMSDLYAGLLTNQEPLEPEFASVLNKNLWDLYES